MAMAGRNQKTKGGVKMKKNLFRIMALAVIGLTAMACATATGSTVMVGAARPVIEPDQVQLYLEAPPSFEIIGLVEASSDAGWTAQGCMDYAIAKLKNQAANIGANGVLLGGTGSTNSGTVMFYSGGVGYGVPVEAKAVNGQAIYVY
jgi:hypothetical protein